VLKHFPNTVFTEPIIISIPAHVREKSTAFVEAMGTEGQSCGYYAHNRNTDSSRANENINTSKLGEWVAAQMLFSQFGFPRIEVNFDVLNSNKKKWSPDLDYPPPFPPVHVKSTSRDYGRGFSWTFQYKNASGAPGGTDALFSKINSFNLERFFRTRMGTTDAPDMIAYVHVPLPNKLGRAMAFASWRSIVERGLLRDPIRPEFVGTKLCIDYDDLLKAFQHGPNIQRTGQQRTLPEY